MWIFQFMKYALSSSLDYFSTRIAGRFVAFAIQLVLSYLAVSIFTFIVAKLAVPLFYGGDFVMNVISADVILDWLMLTDPVWWVTIVIAVNYLFRMDPSSKRMSFTEFYGNRTSAFWFELFLAILMVTILLILYHRKELYYPVNYSNDLEMLLGLGLDQNFDFFSKFIESWLSYISMALPIVAIVVLEIRERKRNGVTLIQPLWKLLISSVVLGFLISICVDFFQRVFSELILNLLYAPFEMIEIPIVIGVFVSVFFLTLKLIALSSVYHFVIQYSTRENENRVLNANINQEILDQ